MTNLINSTYRDEPTVLDAPACYEAMSKLVDEQLKHGPILLEIKYNGPGALKWLSQVSPMVVGGSEDDVNAIHLMYGCAIIKDTTLKIDTVRLLYSEGPDQEFNVESYG